MFDIDYQIPIIERKQYAGNYRTNPVDLTDPRFNEPLIKLESVNVSYESYYAKSDGKNPPYNCRIEGSREDVWLRQSVAEKLDRVNERLRPFYVELLVLDGYRPVECQQGMWNFHYANAQKKFQEANEGVWKKDALGHASPTNSFNPHDSTTWLPHTTGAAIDLTLRELDSHNLVDMGSNFEEITLISRTDYFERQLLERLISKDDPRLQYRRLLYWAMLQEDLVNDPLVYWHYDWGNQLYLRDRKALFGNAPQAAWYGYIEPPPLKE